MLNNDKFDRYIRMIYPLKLVCFIHDLRGLSLRPLALNMCPVYSLSQAMEMLTKSFKTLTIK